MCSTRAENYLFPPQELMYLASIAKKAGHEVVLIDAIACKMDYEKTSQALKVINPDLIVTLTGFECFENDIGVIQKIKNGFPKVKTLCFGYYPTIFSQEIMQKTNIDFLILGEPELVFSQLLGKLSKNLLPADIKGLAFRKNEKPVITVGAQRISNLDRLRIPSHSLLKQGHYSEPLMGKPYTTIQSGRGCPFQCIYCVSTYGKQIILRSSENILQEIKFIVNDLGIRNFRFIDDTFTFDKKRVIELCDKIIESGLRVNWTCLSRLDTLDNKMLSRMKKAGCKRIFLGIESGSQKILDWFKKGYKVEKMLDQINSVHKAGIESLGFFIVGSPLETEEDFNKSVSLALKSNLDYIVVSRLLAYPGTKLFESMKEDIDFSLFSYKNEFKDNGLEKKWVLLEKHFYKAFYFRPKYIFKRAFLVLKSPREFFSNLKSIIGFLLSGKDKSERQDLF